MATKAEAFRSEQQRAAQAEHPATAPKRRPGPSVSRFDDETMNRNASGHAERRGGAVLEASATGKPSRKSTRKSIDHTKRTTNQQLAVSRRLNAPSTRATARRR